MRKSGQRDDEQISEVVETSVVELSKKCDDLESENQRLRDENRRLENANEASAMKFATAGIIYKESRIIPKAASNL